MELRELNLTAFGPFTNRTLRFEQESGGLYIIYGPNEAGKSSSLRALKSLLFGIPARTTDNFVHAHDKLRIGGCLRDRDGRELRFVRRKGNKNTLLTQDGEVLDDSVLNPFLGGVTAELFGNLFAIDHEELVRGGKEILAQKGEVGQALFTASLGSPVVHEVLEQFDKEADELFRPRGSTQVINSALAEYRQLNQTIREVTLSSREWEEHRHALKQATLQLDQLQTELMQIRTEIACLERIRRVLPKLVRRGELFQKLEGLSDIVILPADFGERRRATITELEQARAQERQMLSRLDKLRQQLVEIDVQEAVLAQAEFIDQLHQRLESYRKAQQECPQYRARREQLLIDAQSLLREVRPDLPLVEVEKLHPVLTQRIRITTLGSERQALIKDLAQAEQTRDNLATRLKRTRRTLEQLPVVKPLEALQRAVSTARKAGDMDSVVNSLRGEIKALEKACHTARKRLSLPQTKLLEIAVLTVPARETVERFEQELNAQEQCEQQLREKQEQLAESQQELQVQLDEIRQSGAPPTEQALTEARSRREQIWRLVRRQWLDREDIRSELRDFDAQKTLPEIYESRVQGADEIADRLRREAERVHKQANLQARLKEHQQRFDTLLQQRDELTRKRKKSRQQWQILWRASGVNPLSPREMRAWLERLDKLQDEIRRLEQLRDKLVQAEAIRDGYSRAVIKQLPLPADPALLLDELLQIAEGQIAETETAQRRRQQLKTEIAALEQDLEQANSRHSSVSAELEQWKSGWHAAVETIGLGADALPAEAIDMLEKIRTVFEKQNEAEKLQVCLQQLEQEIETFSRQAQTVFQQVVTESSELPVEQTVLHLSSLLRENQSRASLRRQLEQQIQQLQQEISTVQGTVDVMTSRLQTLFNEAQCSATGTEREQREQMELAEQCSTEYQHIKQEMNVLEREITEAEGMTVTELEQEAEGVDADAVPGRIQMLEQKIMEQLEPKRTVLVETKVREEKALEQMDGGDKAALLAEQSQSILAQIHSSAERYTHLKVAAHILREQIERYRDENQGPLVQRASEHFAALTQGSFQALRTHFFDKDEPELVGIRNNDSIVHVAGMSSGTRDQLYLALRLASLERQLENSQPMPFIVDDILVHFDDQRSSTTLSLLAELAKKTQVIIFTHHLRVVEQANKLKSGNVAVQEL